MMIKNALFALLLSCGSQVGAQPYHIKTAADLPPANLQATAGNPFKGMLTSPFWTSPSEPQDIPASLEFYYIPLDSTMTGPNSFDWSELENLLNGSASRDRHAIVRFYLDYPGKPHRVPQYLVNQGLSFNSYSNFGGGQSPDYTSPLLLNALQQFITAFGANYDGDPRIAFIQLGLLGFWAEWHTYPHDWLPDSTMTLVANWYQDAFDITPLQARYPYDMVVDNGFGLHDDSYAYATLATDPSYGWFFWPKVQQAGYTDFWKQSVMGGEAYPGIQSELFSSSFPDTSQPPEQDFNECTDTTHATYMIINYAFQTGYSGQELVRAKEASIRMGYAFKVSRVEVLAATNGKVDIEVEITQMGVAPFYYPLSLELSCNGMANKVSAGVETIIEQGETKVFDFFDVSAASACLQAVTLSLTSTHAYPGNPVKLAQGTGVVDLFIPPPTNTPSPTCNDGIQNQGEEGVDCGGPCPTSCGPTCNDGIQNQGEQGVDCGGPCPASCGPTCNDGIQNQGEQGVDCGGPCPNSCGPTCSDGIQNQGEQAIDCGGPCPSCPPDCSGKECGDDGFGGSCGTCASGQTCNSAQQCVDDNCGKEDFQSECTTTSQCKSMYDNAYDCWNGGGGVCYCGNGEVCGCVESVPPSCNDGIQNQGEQGIDCGGPCPSCQPDCNGKQCGDDGLGGSCGTCASGQICNNAQQCVTDSCGREDFQSECKKTSQCKKMYANAYDCWNGGGGVCYCGNGEVCGCL